MAFKSVDSIVSFEYLILIISLFFVLILISLYKKKFIRIDNNKNKKLIVLEKIYLDNKTKVSVIEYEGQKHFVVSNSSSVSISARLDS